MNREFLSACTAAIFLLAATALSAAPSDLLMHSLSPSSGGTIWLGQYQHVNDPYEPDQEDTTAIWERGIMGVGIADWSQLDSIDQRVVSMANFGPELALLGQDGEWYIMSPDGEPRDGPPPQHPVRLVTFASDGDTLWALGEIPGGLAALNRATTGPSTKAATEPAVEMPAGPADLALFEFSGSKWIVHGPILPFHAPAGAGFVSLAVVKSQPWVAFTTNGATPLRILDLADNDTWQPLDISIPITPEGTFKLLSFAPRPWLWVSSGANGWGDLYYSGDFSRKISLAGNGNAGTIKARAVTVAGSHIKMMILNSDGKLLEQDFNSNLEDPNFGRAVGSVAPIMSPLSEAPDVQPWLLISMAMIVVAAAAAFSQRRRLLQPVPAGAQPDEKEPWAQGPPTSPSNKLKLAPNFLRLAAGAIDATPILLWAAAVFDPNSATTVTDFSDPQIAIPGLIALMGYLLATTAAELICGASLGKILFGMRVVTAEGKPPAPMQTIVRNALRVLDLFLVPLILMLFSPLRQRVGDMAANTVVIEPDAPPAANQDG